MSNSPRFEFFGPLSSKIVQLKLNIQSLRDDIVRQINNPDEDDTIQKLKINFLQYVLYKANLQLNDFETRGAGTTKGQGGEPSQEGHFYGGSGGEISHKGHLHIVIFAFYCSFKNHFYEKSHKKFSNPYIP